MKKIIFCIFISFMIFACKRNSSIGHIDKTTQNNKIPIRIGWQIPWAIQGQLTQILKKTSILDNVGFTGDFKGFSYGGPLNEAALAKEVDLIFTADQPAITLISKNPNWVIIGRLMYNRVALYVPPYSPIKNIEDLKGKTVGMPFGAAAQRMVFILEKNAGLDPKKDVNNINLGIYEQSDIVRNTNAQRWGEIDALAGFDPTPAIFEEKGYVRILHVDKIVSVIVMSNQFINKFPDSPTKFLQAFVSAFEYYRNNISQANNWFIEESKLNVSNYALKIAASIEPNLELGNKIRIGFIKEDFKIMQDAADFLFDQKMIDKPFIIKNHIDTTFLCKLAL